VDVCKGDGSQAHVELWMHVDKGRGDINLDSLVGMDDPLTRPWPPLDYTS